MGLITDIKKKFNASVGQAKKKVATLTGRTPAKKQQAKKQTTVKKQEKVYQTYTKRAKIEATGNKAPKPNKAISTGLKVLDIIDRPRNAVANGIEDVKKGENSFAQGFKEGLHGKERVSGSDFIKAAKLDKKASAGAANLGKKLGLDDKKVKNLSKNTGAATRVIGGLATDILMDPTTVVTAGVGGLAKGVLTGIGGTVSKEAVEKGTTLAGKQLLRATGAKAVNKNVVSRVTKDMVKDGALNEVKNPKLYQKALKELVTHGDTSVSKATKEGQAAHKTYQKFAKEVAKDKGVDIQKMANANSGKGVSLFGQSLVSANKMRDVGAKINKATIGKIEPLKNLNESLNQALIKNYRPGMSQDSLQLMKLIDQGKRGTQNRLVNQSLKDIGGTTKELSWKEDQRVRQALEGKIKPESLTKKEKVAHDVLKNQLGKTKDREQATRLLGKTIDDYFPHTMSLDHRIKAEKSPWHKKRLESTEQKANLSSLGKTINPHARARKFKGNIADVNEVIKKATGVDGYFETSARRGVSQRVMDSSKRTGNALATDDFIETFGEAITNKELKQMQNKLSKKWKDHTAVIPKREIDGMLLDPKTNTTVRDMADRVQDIISSEGVALEDAVAKAIDEIFPGYTHLNKPLSRLISQTMHSADNVIIDITDPMNSSLLQTLGEIGGAVDNSPRIYAVPTDMANEFMPGRATQSAVGDMMNNPMVKAPGNLWRKAITELNPGYFVRNWAGNIALGAQDVGARMLNPGLYGRAATAVQGGGNAIKAGGKNYSADELRNMAYQFNVLGTDVLRGDLRTQAENLVRGVENKWTMNPFKRANEGIDDTSRMANFMGNLDKGLDPVTAAANTRQWQIDYQDLTDTERGLRNIVPFYTFTSKNLQNQMMSQLDRPGGLLQNINRLSQNTQDETGVNPQHLPGYIADRMPMFTGNKGDNEFGYMDVALPQLDPMRWLPQGNNPWEVAKNTPGTIAKNILTSVAPGLQNFVEEGTGKDVFSGRELDTPLSQRILTDAMPAWLRNTVTPVDYSKAKQSNILGLGGTYNQSAGEISSLYDREAQLNTVMQQLKAQGVNLPDNIGRVRKAQGYKYFDSSSPWDMAQKDRELQDMNISMTPQEYTFGKSVNTALKSRSQKPEKAAARKQAQQLMGKAPAAPEQEYAKYQASGGTAPFKVWYLSQMIK